MPTPTDHRRRNLEVWEAIADGWERQTAFVEEVFVPVTDWMLRELALEPGQTLLELAAGTGDLGFRALAEAGEGARLLSTDLSPALVDAGRRRAATLGLAGVEHQVVDAEATGLPDDAADAVLCRHGFMFAADPAAALAETRRVLRPGGRLVLSVWGPPDRNPFFAPLGRSLVTRGHMPPPAPGAPGLFALADAARLRDLLTGAGFPAVRVDDVAVRFAIPSVEAFLEIATDNGGSTALVLRRLSPDDRAAVAGDLREAFAPFGSDDGYVVPGVTLCGVAA